MTVQFFDMSVQTQAPNGYQESLPITLGPNWQPNDLRIVFVSGSGSNGNNALMAAMNPDPPTSFTKAYSLNPGFETHGAYYRRLASGDSDNVGVAWNRPEQGWTHFMFGLLTARGVSPSSTPTGGSLSVIQNCGDTTATVSSVSVPGAGVMIFFVGNVQTPGGDTFRWPVSMGVPTGWTNLVATDKSGINFYQYGTDPAILVVAKTFSGSGSTGAVSVPTARGGAAFAGLYMFLTAAADVSVTVGAA